ncbi:MAG: extracellular solute-binding protein, partial [Clostridiales bacterium]|nr:extracellular solute-binding protein [Clostridiales bacterium]
MNKRLLLGVFILSALLLFAGCGKRGAPAAPSQTDANGRYQEPVTITVVGAYSQKVGSELPPDVTPQNQSFVKAALDTYNIDIKYLWTCPPDQFEQKMGVAMASGDLPDVMRLDVRQYELLRDGGQLADLTGALDAAGEKFRSFLYKNPDVMERMRVDGKVYAIPQYWDSKRNLDLMYIRTDWLKNLGMRVPETAEELKTVAAAFSKNDPDQNGRADTVGIAMARGVDAWMCDIKGYFASLNSYPKKWLSDGAGGVAAGETLPETKDALRFMRELYQSGAIDKEFIIKDEDKITEEIIAGRYGIVYGPWHQFSAYLAKAVENNPGAKWEAFPIPGTDGTGKAVIDRLTIDNYTVVNKNCANPEAVIRLMNLFIDFTPGNFGDMATPAGGFAWDWVTTTYYDPYDIDTKYDKMNKAIEEGAEAAGPMDADERDVYDRYLAYNRYLAGEEQFNAEKFGYIYACISSGGSWNTTREIFNGGHYVFNEISGLTTQSYQDKGATLD